MSRLRLIKKSYDFADLDGMDRVIPTTPLYPQDYFKQRDPELLKKNKELHDKGQYIEDLETLTNPTMTAKKSRLRKIADLMEGFMYGGSQFEVYKNPSSKEIGYVKEESMDQGVRGVIYDNGDIIIWPSDVLHHQINSKIAQKIDIENCFRFAGYSNSAWIIDAHAKYTVDQTIELIKKYKNTLAKFGNIDKDFTIFYASGNPSYYEFSLAKDNNPTKDQEERDKKRLQQQKEREERMKNKVNDEISNSKDDDMELDFLDDSIIDLDPDNHYTL